MNGNNSKNNIQLGEFLFSRIYSNDEHNKTGIIVTRVDQQMSTKSRRDRHNSRSNKQDKTRRSRSTRSTRKCSKDETGSISNSSSSSQCSGTRRTNDRDENDSQRSSSSRRRRTRRTNDRDEKDKQRSRGSRHSTGSRHTTSSRHTSSRKNGNNKWSSNQQKALEAKAATLCQLIADQGLFEKNKNNPDQREFMGYELINHMILIGMCDTRWEGVRFGKDLSKRLNLFDRIDDDDDDANKSSTFSDDMNVYKLRGAFKSILNISKNIDEAWRTDQDKVERSKNSKRKSDKMKKKKEIKPIKETEHEVVRTMKKQLRRHYQTEQVNHTEALMNELKAKTSSMYTGHHRIITADQGITTIDEEKEEENGITTSTASKTTSKSDAIVSIEEEEEKSYMEFTVLDYEEEIIEESVDDNNDDDDDDDSFIEMTVMEEDDEESYAEYTIVEEDDDNFCPTDVKHSSFQTTPKRSNSSLIIKNNMGAYGMEIAFRDLDDDEITQITMLPF